MQRKFFAGLCAIMLFGSVSSSDAGLFSLPISDVTAGVGAAGIGAATWGFVNAIAKQDKIIALHVRNDNPFLIFLASLKFPVKGFSVKFSAVLATIAAVPGTWLGWKLFSSWTARGYRKRAEKIIFADVRDKNRYGRPTDQAKFLQTIKDGFQLAPDVTSKRVVQLFGAQRNELAKAVFALESLQDEILQAQDFLYCSARGYGSENSREVNELMDYVGSLLKVIEEVSQRIKTQPNYQAQYENELNERKIIAERENAAAMRAVAMSNYLN